MSNFTQAVILNTFSEMLETTPFEKITVSSIVKACSISRNTFYYHYQDIYDLLDDWLRHSLGDLNGSVENDDWQNSIKSLLYSCKAHRRRVYHVFNSISRDRLERYVFAGTDNTVRDYVLKRAEGKGLSDAQIDTISDIVRYAIIGYLLRFLWNGMNDDIEKSVDSLSTVFAGIVDQAVEHPERLF